MQPHRHFNPQSRLGSYSRSSLSKPTSGSFSRQEVGLGKARQFSSATQAAEIIQNAPLLLRAALDALDCPSKAVQQQAPHWNRVCINTEGRIALGPRARFNPAVATSSIGDASTSDLFLTEGALEQPEAALELLVPSQPHDMPTFPFELDALDADRLLSPAFSHVLERQGACMRRHVQRFLGLLKVLKAHGQLVGVQLVTLSADDCGAEPNARQLFRVAVRSWTEEELRQALGLFPKDAPPWEDIVDWRKVHSYADSDEGLSASTEQEMDFVFPRLDDGFVEERGDGDDDLDHCDVSSAESFGGHSGIGPGSLLRDLDELSSPRFRPASLPVHV